MGIRIGLDFDGTIVVHDDVLHRHAVALYGLPPEVPARKDAVREWLRANAPGEDGWIALQRHAYGLRLGEAAVAPGLPEFLDEIRDAGVEVAIVSHKTRLSVARPAVDLHAAALAWLEDNGFFAGGHAIRREDVFFEPTRSAKIGRIVSTRCVLFVDDLPEVFEDPGFPPDVERWLYAAAAPAPAARGVTAFSDWRLVAQRIRALQEALGGD